MPPLPGTILRCPVCGHGLTPEPAGWPRTPPGGAAPLLLSCPRGHRFDAARQGYFNLLTGRGTAFQADTAAMVQARIDFLGAGHFLPLADAVSAAASEHVAGNPVILDAGAGTGYYLQAVRRSTPGAAAIALDISKYALRRAAVSLPGVLCLVCDVWQRLPVADESVDVLMNIFAPRNPEEFARVTKSGGILLVVTPLPEHLQEIAHRAGLLDIRPGKGDDTAATLGGAFEETARARVQFRMMLSAEDIRNVAAMGPAGHHRVPLTSSPLPQPEAVTAAFTVQTFRRRPRRG